MVFPSGSQVKLGRIRELVPSSDGEVRKVMVELEGHNRMQAVANLCHVEAEMSPVNAQVGESWDGVVSNAPDADDPHTSSSDAASAIVPPVWELPKREAALQAQCNWLVQFLLWLS